MPPMTLTITNVDVRRLQHLGVDDKMCGWKADLKSDSPVLTHLSNHLVIMLDPTENQVTGSIKDTSDILIDTIPW